jgi:hypothetical protein
VRAPAIAVALADLERRGLLRGRRHLVRETRRRGVTQAEATLRQHVREIDVLDVREVALFEAASRLEGRTGEKEAAPRREGDVGRDVAAWEGALGHALTAMPPRARDSARSPPAYHKVSGVSCTRILGATSPTPDPASAASTRRRTQSGATSVSLFSTTT